MSENVQRWRRQLHAPIQHWTFYEIYSVHIYVYTTMGFMGFLYALLLLICERRREVNIIIVIYTSTIILQICRLVSRVPFTLVIYEYVVREERAKSEEREFSAKSLGFIFDVVGACEKRAERSTMTLYKKKNGRKF